jgi:hypothetical protein
MIGKYTIVVKHMPDHCQVTNGYLILSWFNISSKIEPLLSIAEVPIHRIPESRLIRQQQYDDTGHLQMMLHLRTGVTLSDFQFRLY